MPEEEQQGISINLSEEKDNIFSARARYDIIADAIEAAYDDGFMNGFIFPRVVLLGIAAQYFEDDFEYDRETFESPRLAIKTMPLELWDLNLQNDVLIKTVDAIPLEVNDILQTGNLWFMDYTSYAYSLRGLLDNIAPLIEGVTQRADQELNDLLNNGEIQEAINTGKDWGLQTPGQSLFQGSDELKEEEPLVVM